MRLDLGACALAFAGALAVTAPASAANLEPARPVPAALYSGRWYEVARTPNHTESRCLASTTDFSRWRGGDFAVVQTCHKAGPDDPTSTMNLHGRVLPASENAKIELYLLGGLITQQYWILDHAADGSWLIMTTPNDRYIWLMAREPTLSGPERAAALARMQSLGLDASRLAFLSPAR